MDRTTSRGGFREERERRGEEEGRESGKVPRRSDKMLKTGGGSLAHLQCSLFLWSVTVNLGTGN